MYWLLVYFVLWAIVYFLYSNEYYAILYFVACVFAGAFVSTMSYLGKHYD